MRGRLLFVGSLLGASLAVVGATLVLPVGNAATTLEDFEISTGPNAVKIILHTDERTTYTTDSEGNQFSVTLSNTRLSPETVKAGLPVITDSQNKWIGRAVPLDGDRVKITIPNLPASQYAISVIQKKSVETQAATAPRPEVVRPRSAMADQDAALDAIIQRFQEKRPSYQTLSAQPPAVKSPTPSVRVKPAPKPVAKTTPRPAPAKPTVAAAPQPARKTESVATVAVSESVEPVVRLSEGDEEMRPISVMALENDVLEQLRQGEESALASGEAFPPEPVPAESSSLPWWKALLQSIPSWVLIGAGLLLFGLSVFLGIKTFRFLLDVLHAGTAESVVPKFRPVSSTLDPAGVGPSSTVSVQGRPAYQVDTASKPVDSVPPAVPMPDFDFSDTPHLNALEYLMASSQDIREAVQNTTHVKFSSNPKRRSIPRRAGGRTPGAVQKPLAF
jgi:hypothetical protein